MNPARRTRLPWDYCRKVPRLVFWLMVLGGVRLLAPASAQNAQNAPRFEAQVDQTQVNVGEPIQFSLTIETSGNQADGQPTIPDWGGLTVRGGPFSNRQISYSNVSGMQSVLTFQWRLVAPREGKFTIGSSRMAIGGRVYQTTPITVTAALIQQTPNVPADLQGEPIISARTADPQINEQLKGRLFLRAEVSNKNPYVGEPVVVTYSLYNDRVQLAGRMSEAVGEFQGFLREELYHAKSINDQAMNFSGKQFQVAPMVRLAVTPTKTGKLLLEGYAMQGTLQVRRPQGGGFNDPFFGPLDSVFDDPVFGGGLKVELPNPPVQLNVRPLPAAGRPANFSGTVGDFTLRAQADRNRMTTDDLLTLRVSLEGRGAVELTNPPVFPAAAEFEVVGQNPKLEKEKTQAGIGGRKIFELVLRPRRSGQLTAPEIEYPIFNPFTGKYATLRTTRLPIEVAPGKAPPPTAVQPGSEASQPDRPPRRELNYIKSIQELQPKRPLRLLELPAFWLLHAAAFTLLGLAWRRSRRLAHMDQARMRRAGAWRGFARRARLIRQQSAQGLNPQVLASQVDHAARTCIADHFNLSADGLTRVEIERRLLDHAVPRERVQRLCDLLDQCAALSYAPIISTDGELGGWIAEIAALIKENLRG